MKICSVGECGKRAVGRGLCSAHYAKWQKYGDPLTVKQAQKHGLTLEERFWSSVKTGDGCWEWQAGRDPNGYGRIAVAAYPMLAHRLSWEIAHRVKLTPAQHVLHKCDNPCCVRPSHLMLGDQAANMADKMSKGRHKYGTSMGEAHGCAKLADADIRAIRSSAEAGVHLAKAYGVTPTTISDVRNRRIWKHID